MQISRLMSSTDALIIFVRKPEKGKVKTRLATAIGEEAALAVYRQLLAHTRCITAELICDKFLYYAGEIDDSDDWGHRFQIRRQVGGDLGQRMRSAFTQLFEEGYSRICIIGSDCFELSAAIIQNAFAALHHNEVVLGPAKDGGYYLLGMRNGVIEVFDGIPWSTNEVLAKTKSLLEQQRQNFALLPMLTDVDTVDDLPEKLVSLLRLKKG